MFAIPQFKADSNSVYYSNSKGFYLKVILLLQKKKMLYN